MPLTYPLAQDQFVGILPIGEMSMDLPEQVEVARTGSGALITADVGDRLWQGSITLGTLTNAEAGRAQVLIDLLREGGRTFMAYDARRPAPLLDPGGNLLGAAAVAIATLPSDSRELSLNGMPPGYTLISGDYLAFSYSSAPVRYALHRVVDAWVTADATGTSPVFEVMPALRPGAAVGAAVTLVKAACKVQLVPGSVQAGSGKRTIFSGQSFGFVQTLG